MNAEKIREKHQGVCESITITVKLLLQENYKVTMYKKILENIIHAIN